jgi:hypothetical protein
MVTLPSSVKIYLALDPADMRNYVQSDVMRSLHLCLSLGAVMVAEELSITPCCQCVLSISRSLSGAVKRPGRRRGALPASRAFSFSAGSALR